MSKEVNVSNDAGLGGNAILFLGAAGTAGALYYFGLNERTLQWFSLGASVVLIAFMMWYILTAYDKLVEFLAKNQLMALVGSCILAAGAVGHWRALDRIGSVMSMHK